MNTDSLENFRKAFENLKPKITKENNILKIDNKGKKFKVSLTPKSVKGIGYSR